MKKIFLLLTAIGCIGIFTSLPAFAIQAPTYGVYDTREAFDASGEGYVCKVVTDGCSEFKVTDEGKTGDPIKACKVTADFDFQWTCKEGADNIYYFGGGGTVGGDADVHGCIASAGYQWSAAQKSCLRLWEQGLSEGQLTLYADIKEDFNDTQENKVVTVFHKYQNLLKKFNIPRKIKINNAVIKRLDVMIDDLVDNYPTNLALPYAVNVRVRTLSLLMLEMKIRGVSLANVVTVDDDKSVYECDDGRPDLTVYRDDYTIDDMSFQLDDDEIHVSDGEFMLPNYNATREVVHIGEKFVGKDTENDDEVTFYFKNEDMSFYRGDTLVATCTVDE